MSGAILAIIVVVLLILVFGGVAALLMGKSSAPLPPAPTAQSAPAAVPQQAPAPVYQPAPAPVPQPSPPQSFMFCEGDYATSPLSCPAGKTVNVTSAQYGRFDTNVCKYPGGAWADVPCAGADITGKLQSYCAGKGTCSWGDLINNITGSDPCPNIYKQVRGSYSCV